MLKQLIININNNQNMTDKEIKEIDKVNIDNHKKLLINIHIIKIQITMVIMVVDMKDQQQQIVTVLIILML